MFSGITSFLFGSADEETLGNEDVRLRVTPVDDEWALVDRSNCAFSCVTKDGECPCNSTDHLMLGNLHHESTNSDSDSASKRASMDESWIVDPPSCFTGGRSQSPETSPMEDLLLEHPSMSVYNSRGRPNSAGIESDSGRDSPIDTRSRGTVVKPTARRPRAVSARAAGLLPKTQLAKSMQHAKRRAGAKNLTRHHMERHNKSYNLRALDCRVRVQQPRKSNN